MTLDEAIERPADGVPGLALISSSRTTSTSSLGVLGHRPARRALARDRAGAWAPWWRRCAWRRRRGCSGSAAIYVETFRNIPLLVLLFISFAGLRRAGVDIAPWTAGIASLGLYTAAYVAEALRSGVFAVSRGQREAALSLGFSEAETLRRIVLPQAFRTVIPPLGLDHDRDDQELRDHRRVAAGARRHPQAGADRQLADVPDRRGVLLGRRRLPAAHRHGDARRSASSSGATRSARWATSSTPTTGSG